MKLTRTRFIAFLLAGGLGLWTHPGLAADSPAVQVFKSPTCGCCAAWVRHLKDNGFTVTVTDRADMAPVKAEYRIPPQLSSCHTAVVDGYVIEGHVPASDIVKLLKERPKIRGLVVPGMPMGSPGMEGPDPEAYDTLALDANGATTVFTTHGP
jgi:hypothetical protein